MNDKPVVAAKIRRLRFVHEHVFASPTFNGVSLVFERWQDEASARALPEGL